VKNMAQNVKFVAVKLQSTFDALTTKDALTLYWIQDTQRVYHGAKLMGSGLEATAEFAGLMSAEDKAALEALKAGTIGGLTNLAPLDGTISIMDTANGGKAISVALAPVTGNALTAVNGGLFVPVVSVPEYAIEKQETAEDGYSASYRLKKTVDGEVSYVGDTINIAKDLVLKSATLEIVTENGVPYESAVVGDPYICMVFNDTKASNLYIPVKGLVDKMVAGTGIVIDNNVVSVKLADNAHGLVAVDGALSIALATKNSDGAMSKEDKRIIESIPSVYVAKKYDISDTPVGTLVNYGEKEIRIMCPADAVFTKQNVGENGNANMYYMTFKAYAPDGAVSFKEGDRGTIIDDMITFDDSSAGVDEFGRKYSVCWLALASYDSTLGTWTYFGKNSTENKYVGWDYVVEWYDQNGIKIAADSIRINLSNETCHNSTKPYYMANYATIAELSVLKESVQSMEDSYTWSEL
jgi:hypothetical protein